MFLQVNFLTSMPQTSAEFNAGRCRRRCLFLENRRRWWGLTMMILPRNDNEPATCSCSTQPVGILGNLSTPFGTLAIRW